MPKTNGDRVLADLNTLRAMGAYKSGVHRPSLSPEHMQSMNWLKAELEKIGHDVTIDGIGNVIGLSRKPGKKLLSGSHLESQNYAGWLDGALGVVYALEAARAMHEDPTLADVAVDVAAWFDEEGHFGHFLGSRSFCGELTEDVIDQSVDRTNGETLRDALKRVGLAGRPRLEMQPGRYVGFLEAHIEQGDWLEANDLRIGVVTSIVAIWQYRITVEGVQNHAGTTRMAVRKDAGLAAVKLLDRIDQVFPTVAGERSVWTTGRITLDPGGPSIIPGGADVWFQLRDADIETLERMDAKLRELVAEADAKGPCKVSVDRIRTSLPAVMDPRFRAAFEKAGNQHAPGKAVQMPSGAGHDAQVLAAHVPAGMLFVPSIGGISHHWTENTKDEDIALGAQVFADAAADLLKTL